MKKITFLVATILLAVNVARASGVIKATDVSFKNSYSFNEPIEFSERGILFFIFPNGEFDFNTRPDDSHGDYYYKKAGRRFDNNDRRNPSNYGVLIEKDNFGRIRRIGNTFINYDFNDRVSRIGSVFMRYNRFALAQVGGLQLVYNRYGEIIDSYGSVQGNRNRGFSSNYYGPRPGNCTTGYSNINYNNENEYAENQSYNNTNNDSYYYKSDGSKAKIEDDDKNEKEKEKASENKGRR